MPGISKDDKKGRKPRRERRDGPIDPSEIDFLGRLEGMDEDFPRICKRIVQIFGY